MADYIERNKVYRALNTLLNSAKVGAAWNNILRCLPILKNITDTSADYDEGLCDGLSSAINKIEAIPVADVYSKEHGKWLLERQPDGTPYCYHCSVCDDGFRRISITTAYAYCPFCGAKMENERVYEKDGEQE